MPEAPRIVKTVVTTELVRRIADAYGVQTEDVLTGFKYIGNTLDKTIQSFAAGSMAVKPFGFTLEKMQSTGEGNTLTYSINIPGFVFMVVNDGTGISMGDIDYLTDGSSNITFIDLDASVLGEAKTFTAYALTKTDGSKLSILSKTVL